MEEHIFGPFWNRPKPADALLRKSLATQSITLYTNLAVLKRTNRQAITFIISVSMYGEASLQIKNMIMLATMFNN